MYSIQSFSLHQGQIYDLLLSLSYNCVQNYTKIMYNISVNTFCEPL